MEIIIIKIQAIYRGFNVRKNNKLKKDDIDKDDIYFFLNNYIKQNKHIDNINLKLKVKKLRYENFPSFVSENIVKFIFYKKYGIFGNWDIKTGDLIILKKKIEVKSFISKGPTSFGPTESWDYICFVDSSKYNEYFFTVYLFKLSNKHKLWKNIILNKKNETFEYQCLQGRRPRICFNDLKNQLKNHYKIIYNDYLYTLFT